MLLPEAAFFQKRPVGVSIPRDRLGLGAGLAGKLVSLSSTWEQVLCSVGHGLHSFAWCSHFIRVPEPETTEISRNSQ